jgi:hypothetical protein
MNVCEISKKMKCMREYIVLQIYICIRVILINGLYIYIYRTNLIMIMILHYYFKLISDIQYHSQKDKIKILL